MIHLGNLVMQFHKVDGWLTGRNRMQAILDDSAGIGLMLVNHTPYIDMQEDHTSGSYRQTTTI